MDFLQIDYIEDDLDIIEAVEVGLPRQIYERSNYFQNISDQEFFKRFRLTKHTVAFVLQKIEHRLEFPYDTNNSVAPINQILVALRFYATGNHLLSVADFGGMHVSTACRIVKRVSEAIALLCNEHIKFPSTPEEIHQAQIKFYQKASFPKVIGAVDGTHVRIQSPGGNDAELFRNRKNYFSINVQGISNADLKFINIVARWPGSAHDTTIFNNSNIRAAFEMNTYNDSVLLGDSAYNIRSYLLTPLLNPVGEAQQLYNEAHIRTRGTVEKLFGVWKRRFPIVAYGSRLKLNNTLTVIVATAVLHNIARDMNEDVPPMQEFQADIDNIIEYGNIHLAPQACNIAFRDARTRFINYFSGM